jgi:hypothetical protein
LKFTISCELASSATLSMLISEAKDSGASR